MQSIQKKWFIHENKGKIDDYILQSKSLGEGASGSVFLAKHRVTKINRAIKRISKRTVKNQKRLVTQINILRSLDHPNIIRLFETFEDENYLYLVMQLCEGGELFDIIVQKQTFTEDEAKKVFKQIVQAVSYCHQHNICHRDLKPQNFLYLNKSETSPIKVIDFGFSAILENKSPTRVAKDLKTKVGTVHILTSHTIFLLKCCKESTIRLVMSGHWELFSMSCFQDALLLKEKLNLKFCKMSKEGTFHLTKSLKKLARQLKI